ncbi:MAG: esterase family protein [Armatimonadetes bacterium]|nr:esterase family protein [Armatimonadota bacterium]
MALLHVDFFSESLGLSCNMDVILPQPTTRQIGLDGATTAGPYKTLYLLHGMSDDHTIWQRRTSIERYVSTLPLAVVMPAVSRSMYCDMAHGLRYWTFVADELPALCRSWFPLSAAREDNFVAGLSMGGYGAFKLALARPTQFAAAASLSGALDVATRLGEAEGDWRREMENVYGDLTTVAGSDNDLLALLDKLAASEQPRPRLFQWCGTEDFLYEHNHSFLTRAAQAGVAVDYTEGPGGHTWDKWDEQIQNVLTWLAVGG